ncbi:MAG: fructuronate reductase [Rhodocyclaceae bacterium]
MKNISNTALPAQVAMPGYARDQLKSRIVHLGFGAFHRAHQSLLTDRVLNAQGGDWGICEVNLVGGEELIAQLREQGHLYSVLEKGATESTIRVIGTVVEALHPTFDGIEAVLAKMTEPQVAIVSITVTEKGYCVSSATGELDKGNPGIAKDLANPAAPGTVPGVIVEALRRRRAAGVAPFTVLSCDNIPENGHVVKHAVLGMAEALDKDLAAWIAQNVSFPSTMVDRIVPAATVETLGEIAEALGVSDPVGIACEPFIQWVVEDNFVAGRPQWEVAGAELVKDVLPYEEMKLRMLNGSHSFLAYLGYLGGYEHINDCMTDAAYKKAAHRLMLQEQAPTLKVQGVDLAGYADRLIDRYSNPNLKHRTWQIAMDGTQKLPQRMLDSIRAHLKADRPFPCLALGVAGWMRYVGGVDEQGKAIDVRDPLAAQLASLCTPTQTAAERVAALLSIKSVFNEDLAAEPCFVEAVTAALDSLMKQGARATVAQLAG